MPRLPRLDAIGVAQHVIQRGNNRQIKGSESIFSRIMTGRFETSRSSLNWGLKGSELLFTAVPILVLI